MPDSIAPIRISLLIFFTGMASALAQSGSVESADFSVKMRRVGRIRNFESTDKLALDKLDGDLQSPKSVKFSSDGRKFYINALESGNTIVYSWPDIVKLKTIRHRFDSRHKELFAGEQTVFDYPYYTTSKTGDPNEFAGKPVESELSHGGRYLWVTYYRRSYDSFGQSPSAVAIIDTKTEKIVRVMPTGPIPKYVSVSPDGRYVAIVHWGDNTVGIIDIRSNSPRDFKYVAHVTIENQLSQADFDGLDRDKNCGYCLRGAVFSPDSQMLYVARMGGGGIAGIDVSSWKYLGSVMNVPATPRHIVASKDNSKLLVSSNVSGELSEISISKLNGILKNLNGRQTYAKVVDRHIDLGYGARTLDISNDGLFAFVAVNNLSKVVLVHLPSFQQVSEIDVDPYPVGLAVSPREDGFIVTSQGAGGVGGNAVNIIQYSYDPGNRPFLNERR